jgi:hypothetical protein
MAHTQTKDTKVVDPMNDGAEDVAVGLQEEVTDYTYVRSLNWGVFYQSVLFQMLLFGA